MSNYRALAYHPTSGRLEVADWLDDFYGTRVYGVRFADGHTRHAHKIRKPSAVDLFLVAQEMADVLLEECASDDAYAALAKWRDLTNAKEKTDG